MTLKISFFDTRMLNSEHKTYRYFSVYFEVKSDFDREFEKETPSFLSDD